MEINSNQFWNMYELDGLSKFTHNNFFYVLSSHLSFKTYKLPLRKLTLTSFRSYTNM